MNLTKLKVVWIIFSILYKVISVVAYNIVIEWNTCYQNNWNENLVGFEVQKIVIYSYKNMVSEIYSRGLGV